YKNSTDVIISYVERLKTAGIKPKLVCWSVGFMRRAEALIEAGLVDEPAYFLLHMTDGPFLTGHPGTVDGLEAHPRFLASRARHYWTTNIVGGNLLNLCQTIAQRGGNVAPGIGDYSYKELGSPRNEEITHRAASIARSAGREIASPQDVREMLEF